MCILMRTCASVISVALVALMWTASCEAGEAPDMTGVALYQEFCATCHGVSGHGDGPVALSLKRRVPDLTLIAKRNGGEFPAEAVHRMIDGRSMPRSHGTSDMPVWGWEFYGYEGEDAARRQQVAELIDRLVEYLKSIQGQTPPKPM
jgi:mono/diheme cytochrome c family protein